MDDYLRPVLAVGTVVAGVLGWFHLMWWFTRCQVCGALLANSQKASFRQRLVGGGGRTCRRCGFRLDQWGKPRPGQAVPVELAKRLNLAPKTPDVNSEQAAGSNDIQRRGDIRG